VVKQPVAAVEVAVMTFANCTTTYTPIYGTGRMFVCSCGMETDDGFAFWTTHGAGTDNRTREVAP